MRALFVFVLLVLVSVGLWFLLWDDEPQERTVATQDEPAASAKKAAPKTQNSTTNDLNSSASSADTTDASSTAATTTSTAQKPVIVEKQAPNSESGKSAENSAIIPSFDVVRVDKNCGILVAGRAEPAAKVTIYANEAELGHAYASRRGEWVFLSTEPLPAGSQQINAVAVNPNKQELETLRMVIMQVPDCSKDEKERAPALAVLAPKESDQKTAIEERVSKLLQMPEPQGNVEAAENLNVGSIDYDEKGNVALSGKGKPGNNVQVYLKNKPIGTAQVDDKGNWKLVPKEEIAPGTYDLRADQLDRDGDVISRVEIPFQRESAEDVILAKGGLEIRAVVQPGNSLWRIARRMYGEGTHYTVIYQANEKQIKDPDLIYPGQIFTLPSKDKVN
ncbi:LysM peptidoglycan-binding domain-containing protein [Sneathiella glossodoripedis]|uniref:LysM peptidoglycan-binding domain-containing protein n=1 Tax=Sneathiella glossodoripedis TaxID=418853 RepID=UPI000B15E789|nr:LysM peptidoglycan-binding domain-containing protein [Sneathiella glossodoripedis]